MARYGVRKGRRVLLVDADPWQASQHVRLDRDLPVVSNDAPDDDRPELAPYVLDLERRGPDLLALALCCPRPAGWPQLDPIWTLEALRRLPYDEIVVDLPSTHDPLSMQLFVGADVPVLLTTTEPVSLSATAAMLRAAVLTALPLHPAARTRADAAADLAESLRGEWTVHDLVAAATAAGLESLLAPLLADLQPYLVFNQTRELAERELGPVLALTWHRQLGVRPRFVGALDHDERRWFHLRQDVAAPALGSEQGTGVQLEEVARRLFDAATVDEEQPRTGALVPADPIDLLGVSDQLDPADIRATWRRMWEGFRRESTISRRVAGAALREALIRELEESNRALQALLQERATTGRMPVIEEPVIKRDHPGLRISRARTDRGLSQREVSLRTRIGVRYLEAIEQFEVEALPRPVYLRGYLVEITRALDLPEQPLLDQYLAAVTEARKGRILTSRPGA